MSEWHRIDDPENPPPKEYEGADPLTARSPWILLRFGDEAVSVAYWDLYYATGGDGCTDGFAWIEPCSGSPLNLYYSTPPTHWAPIPEPPRP